MDDTRIADTSDVTVPVRCDYSARRFATPCLLALHHSSRDTDEVSESE